MGYMDRFLLTTGRFGTGREQSPRSASFSDGCGVDGRFLTRRQRIGKHARSVVVYALRALEVIRPAVAPELSGCDRAPIAVVLLSKLSVRTERRTRSDLLKYSPRAPVPSSSLPTLCSLLVSPLPTSSFALFQLTPNACLSRRHEPGRFHPREPGRILESIEDPVRHAKLLNHSRIGDELRVAHCKTVDVVVLVHYITATATRVWCTIHSSCKEI